jgi:hypothetical protein
MIDNESMRAALGLHAFSRIVDYKLTKQMEKMKAAEVTRGGSRR